MSFNFPIRVYYEDTDAGGVVYYANYLKYAERARTELLRELQVEQHSLLKEQDICFVVRRAEMDLKSPARLDDLLTVNTIIKDIKPASLIMHQRITNGDNTLAEINVKIACVNGALKPTPLPKDLLEKFSNHG